MKTEVCLSVDVEFNIGGAFTRPDLYRPIGPEHVHCVVNGRAQGLGFILETLDEYGFKGTFFTEPLQTAYFGDDPMGEIVINMLARGQDVQLHLHPCWLAFKKTNWIDRKSVPVNDSCSGRTDGELDEIISTGIDVFDRWGVARPVALRTGGFNVDRAVYRAMARAGIPVASNIGLGANPSPDPSLHLANGRVFVETVLEVPCLSYQTRDIRTSQGYRHRLAAITSSGSLEIENLLIKAKELGVATMVIVTHPFEFVKTTDFRYSKTTINKVNQSRLKRLLDFLRRHDDLFEVVTFGGQSQKWLSEPEVERKDLRSGLIPAISRSFENFLNDRVWSY